LKYQNFNQDKIWIDENGNELDIDQMSYPEVNRAIRLVMHLSSKKDMQWGLKSRLANTLVKRAILLEEMFVDLSLKKEWQD
jgi:hypothetical protein